MLPNLASYKQRGGIVERSRKIERINQELKTNDFEIIEIPGDFIKNKTEMSKTGFQLGKMLDTSAVCSLYTKTKGPKKPYILHTEPALPRRGDSSRITPKLKWFDVEWYQKFIDHVYTICNFLEDPLYAVEIHPGTPQNKQNNIGKFVEAIIKMKDDLGEIGSPSPLILIENRTPHIISSGKQIKQFSEQIEHVVGNVKSIGIMLDVQQFYSKTRQDFPNELELIPPNILLGFHIHQKHRCPKLSGPINWELIRNYVQENFKHSSLLILPEVHHRKDLILTYRFCKNYLSL